ncbi:hypothetical protein E4191_10975 [Paracoccus liaowanqingii]|uniref:Uncharacterized protein n=1 Tax=Paracoccus liaowanqingii TaxID=2560053 RepID=A0A4P7HLP4_9RHOB|nr:hypothetical protein [Paracoccus liaowanqingii]QBX35159.1 hypothetical protein E4191_10975 [Paracoccus liaowanqingii]
MRAKHENGVFIGYEPTGDIVAAVSGTPEAIAAMRKRLEDAATPATNDRMEVWLVELDLIAPRKVSSSIEDDLRMQAYLTRLSAYPADVVREALLRRTWRFFPSWAELKDVCDELMKPRLAVLAALERAEQEAHERELGARSLPTEQTAVPTDGEAAARKAEAAHLVNEVLKGMKAKLAADEAAQEADAKAAQDSYAPFRTRGDE